jgi:16S rRNA (guanine527-N7)-methyltransferase
MAASETGHSLFDPFARLPGASLVEQIRARAGACAIELSERAVAILASHARAVLREAEALKLTSITDPGEFLERHLGESFEGAALLDPAASGVLVDVGSGNGYPGLPVALSRPGLAPILVEASTRKAQFLRATLQDAGCERAHVLEAQVQRAADLAAAMPVRVMTCRAVGGWAKILPRLAPCLDRNGEMLIWAGEELEAVSRRVVWHRLLVKEKKALPGRERSWIWRVTAGRETG